MHYKKTVYLNHVYMESWVRHIFFYLLGFLWSLLLIPLFFVCLILPKRCSFTVSSWWTKGILFLARFLLGIQHRVQGREFIPQTGPYIIACKHQSTWETLVFNTVVNDPVFFLKKSLLFIPFIGWILWKLDMIAVSRSRGAKRKESFVELARKQAVLHQRPIIIFPEGTRTSPGTTKRYHQGVYALYKHLCLPVIPVALNSGKFWPRRCFFKQPGTIDLVFMPAINPLLSQEDFMASLFNSIERTSRHLLDHPMKE